MADNRELTLHANEVFESLCERLDSMNLHYSCDPEEYIIRFDYQGEDLPMNFTFIIDEDRQLLRVYSRIPITVPKEKGLEMAVATCIATNELLDGSFDYDMKTGEIFFRLTATFLETDIGDGLFDHLVSYSIFAVEQYNDKFFGLAKGMLNVNDFLTANNQ